MGIAAAISAVVLGAPLVAALAMGVAGAAAAAVLRGLVGDAVHGYVGAAVAALLLVLLCVEHAQVQVRGALAMAATAWCVSELARPARSGSAPLVAMAPAAIAAVLSPVGVVLVAIAGARVVTELRPRPRWAIALPLTGGLAAVIAVVAGTARTGMWSHLAVHWFATPPAAASAAGSTPAALVVSATALAEALGPFVAVAALAGLAQLVRLRRAELALAACLASALLVDLRAGAPGADTLGLASILTGLAVARFAAPIRLPVAQTAIAVVAGGMLLLPPAWSTLTHGPRAAPTRTPGSR